ncbi:MAG: DUF2029 domain-containing protein, partial [Phycisphaerae bacterium]
PFVVDQIRFQVLLERQGLDLHFWCRLSEQFTADPAMPLYQAHPRFLYPPFYLLVIRPLATLPLPWAAFVFETLKWAALFVALRGAWRMASPPDEDAPPIVALGSLLLSWRFFWNDFAQGNINLFLLCGLVAACRLFICGRELSAGALLGAVACVKVTPALMVVWFAYKRRWRVAAGSAAGAAVMLLLLPALWVGWTDATRTLSEWYHHVIKGFVREGAVYSLHINQSLTAIFNRLFADHVALEPDVRVTLVSLPPAVLNALRAALSGLILAALAWSCRGRMKPGDPPLAFASELGLVLIAMLFLSGYSWKAHFVVMLIPYAVLLSHLSDARHAGRKRAVLGCLAVSFALATGTEFLGHDGANQAEAYGLIAGGALAAGLGLLIVRSDLRRAQPPSWPAGPGP